MRYTSVSPIEVPREIRRRRFVIVVGGRCQMIALCFLTAMICYSQDTLLCVPARKALVPYDNEMTVQDLFLTGQT